MNLAVKKIGETFIHLYRKNVVYVRLCSYIKMWSYFSHEFCDIQFSCLDEHKHTKFIWTTVHRHVKISCKDFLSLFECYLNFEPASCSVIWAPPHYSWYALCHLRLSIAMRALVLFSFKDLIAFSFVQYQLPQGCCAICTLLSIATLYDHDDLRYLSLNYCVELNLY